MSFPQRLAAVAAKVRFTLEEALDARGDAQIVEAMRYALIGGKRLRAYFVVESAALFGANIKTALPAAAAIEAMHAYSLVHDDLPCMDDDDLRRGQPTVHVKWDEATAVLVGDALQSLAFELLTNEVLGAARVPLVAGMARAAGAQGMVLGQAQDIAAEYANTPLDLTQITDLQRNKTGALIEWSCTSGALIGGGNPEPLRRYAQAIGLAFQIADDILDVEGDSALAGKRLQKDAEAGKATFVSLLGMAEAKARATELVAEADAELEPFGAKADSLRQAARFVIARRM